MISFLLRLLSILCFLFGLTLIRINARKVRTGQFCDYCTCEDCETGKGWSGNRSLLCADGSHICTCCYSIEPCFDVISHVRKRGGSVFCKEHPDCLHKPKLAEVAE